MLQYSERRITHFAALLVALITLAPISQAAEILTFIHSAHVDTPVTATDASGNPLWRQRMHPYGAALTTTATPGSTAHTSGGIGLHGKRYEPDTGLSYFAAGVHEITAVYSGDGKVSKPIYLPVNQAQGN